MTSELQAGKDVETPNLIPEHPGHGSACLCCLHFAVDFDSMPEVAARGRRPSRLPKRIAAAASSRA